MPQPEFRRAVSRALWLVPVLLLAPGCAEEEWPETYPVKGKVVYPDGKPLTKGTVTFISVDDPELRGYGEIGEDGTFTLATIGHTSQAKSKYLEGTAEGEFKVHIYPYPGGPGGGMGGYTLKKTYEVKATEDNEITVLMETPAKE